MKGITDIGINDFRNFSTFVEFINFTMSTEVNVLFQNNDSGKF